MILRSLLLLVSAFVFSGCGLLDVFTIASVETSIPPSNGLGEEPPSLHYANPNLNLMLPFDLGSFCWTNANLGICVDKIAPEYTEAQHLAASGTMELVFAEPFPATVSLSLYPGSNLFAQEAVPLEASLDEAGQLSMTIPENLDGLYVLAVFATWEGGDAFYTLPIAIER